MFWGATPAINLLKEYESEIGDPPSELNILIIGGTDVRHVLKTLSKHYQYRNVRLNFHLADGCIEILAKQLLLLNIALQTQSTFGLTQKTRLFMELYGNTLIRPFVAKYLTTIACELLKMVTDSNYMEAMMPSVRLDIKYKERDYLENLLKFWYSQDDFDICTYWDQRLRKTLKQRYDSRYGVFDWDLHMRLHQIGAQSICQQEYQIFRKSGISFNWLEMEATKPNRTLVCVVVPNGTKYHHYGYLGDIQMGPFVCYGIECDDTNYLTRTNNENTYRSTDITERNLLEIFHEIEYENDYIHRTCNDYKLGPVHIQYSDRKIIDLKAIDSNRQQIGQCVDLKSRNIEIRFMSISNLDLMKFRHEYKQYFDIIYLGYNHLKYVSSELIGRIVKKRNLLIIENAKFLINYRDNELKQHYNNIRKLLSDTSFNERPFDYLKDNYVKFVINE